MRERFAAIVEMVTEEAESGATGPGGKAPEILFAPGGLMVVTGEPFAGGTAP